MFDLGQAYRCRDLGVAQDCEEAAKWYKMVIDAKPAPGEVEGQGEGEGEGQHKSVDTVGLYAGQAAWALGVLHENGDGVEKDAALAIELYRTSAAKGNPQGLIALANVTRVGVGTPKDEVEAMRLYNEAVRLEPRAASAHYNLAVLCDPSVVHDAGVAKSMDRAFLHYLKAAELGFRHALTASAVADMYEKGEGVERDLEKALGWYVKAAEAGNGAAIMKVYELQGYVQGR